MHHGLAPVGGALNDYACGGSAAMSVWLARPEVVKVRTQPLLLTTRRPRHDHYTARLELGSIGGS